MRKKVLIVDDEVPIRQWMEFIIKKYNEYIIVGSAKNGAEGLEVFENTTPDIVIADIRMPIMNGLTMLEHMYRANPSVHAIILTSHEDFEFARSAIKLGVSDYILKTEITEENLISALDKADSIGTDAVDVHRGNEEELLRRNHFIRSLCLSNDSEQINDNVFSEYNIRIQEAPIVAVTIVRKEGMPYIALSNTNVLKNVIRISYSNNYYCIIGNVDHNIVSQNEIMGRIRAMCNEVIEQGDYFVGCSDIYPKRSQIGIAIRQSRDRVNLRFYHTQKRVFNIEPVGSNYRKECEKYKALFSKAIINQNYAVTVNIKNNLLSYVRKSEISDIAYVKSLCMFFIVTLAYATKDNMESVQGELKAVEQAITECSSIEELEQLINREFENNGVYKAEESKYPAIIIAAIKYIEDNYSKSITLADVSEKVGLSPEYFSRLFKEETGINFIVYLNNVKMKHAIHFLEKTNLKIYEIAEKVGYSNLSYFSTTFKRKFGKSPFEYRQTH